MCKELGRTLDVIRLSDVFRRHAIDDYKETVGQLVSAGRSLSVVMTWYYHEWPGLPENKTTLKAIGRILTDMANDAKVIGAQTLIIPVAKGSPMAEIIEQEVFPKHNFAVELKFQEEEYDADLNEEYGPVDPKVRTALDNGVRGFASYSQEFKYRPENLVSPEL